MDPRIAASIDDIERRLNQRLRVRDLAATVGLSPSRFAHLFHDEFAMGPLEYVRIRRLARARALLERTFLTVKEVMAHVGCSDPSHFARDFRRQYGLGPREWRRRYGPHAPTRPPPADIFVPQQQWPTNSRFGQR